MKKVYFHRLARMLTAAVVASALFMTASCSRREVTITPNIFNRTETQLPNPMKGFACFYEKADPDSSLEYIGLKFSEIYTYQNGQGGLNAEALDEKLANIADRGNAAIIRVYMLNPGYVDKEQTGLFLPEELYNELKSAGDIYSNQVQSGLLEYPDFNSELKMAKSVGKTSRSELVSTVLTKEFLLAMQEDIYNVYVKDEVYSYMLRLVSATRTNPYIERGASPRATIAMVKMSKAAAWLRGRNFVVPNDVIGQLPYVLNHRILLNSSARLSGQTKALVIQQIIDSTERPYMGASQ